MNLVLNSKYLVLLLSSLIFLEVSLPHVAGLKSTYLIMIALLAVIAIPAINNFRQLKLKSFSFWLVALMVIYFLFCLSSVFWSVTKFSTVVHSLLYLITLFFILGACKYDSEKTIDIFQRIAVFCMTASWLALIINPTFALQQKGMWRLRGIFYHEFELGFIAAVVVIICAIRWVKNDVKQRYKSALNFYIIAGFSMATLLATQTRTLLAYTVICVGIAVLFYSKGKKRLSSIFLVGLTLSLLFVFQGNIAATYDRGASDSTLSGRILIWERTLALTKNNELLGHGFGSFTDKKFDVFFTGNYRPPHAHNTWIMSYFETGLVGVSILSLFLVLQLLFGIVLSRRMGTPSYGFFMSLLATMIGATSLIYGGKVAALSLIPLLLLLQQSRELGIGVFDKKRRGG